MDHRSGEWHCWKNKINAANIDNTFIYFQNLFKQILTYSLNTLYKNDIETSEKKREFYVTLKTNIA